MFRCDTHDHTDSTLLKDVPNKERSLSFKYNEIMGIFLGL